MDAKPNYFMAWLFVVCQSLILGMGDAWRLASANAPIIDLFWLFFVQVGCMLIGFGCYNVILSLFNKLRLGISGIPLACLALLASAAIAWYGFDWCAPFPEARRSGALVVPAGVTCFTIGTLIAYFIRMARRAATRQQMETQVRDLEARLTQEEGRRINVRPV